MITASAGRAQLLRYLTQACELEHGLACSYLYAAFSIKTELRHEIDWREQQSTRRWAAQLYFVASQEMLHLAQAWNLMTAIGGTPYYLRPPFPQRCEYYPLELPFVLEPFSARTVELFRQYERPKGWQLEAAAELLDPPDDDFTSVGELYENIRALVLAIPQDDLFLGSERLQVGERLAHFPDLVVVRDRSTALRAIDTITHQGEGAPEDRESSHYGIFTAIARELASWGGNAPAWRTLSNPIPRRHARTIPGATPIEDDFAEAVAEDFDALYSLMLRALAWVFAYPSRHSETADALSTLAIRMMPVLIKPLGEALAQLPSGRAGYNAGAPFTLSRHVWLPEDPYVARRVVGERLEDVAEHLAALARDPDAPVPLRHAAEHLGDMSAWWRRLAHGKGMR